MYFGNVAHVRTSVLDDDIVYIEDNIPSIGAELECELYIVPCSTALDAADVKERSISFVLYSPYSVINIASTSV